MGIIIVRRRIVLPVFMLGLCIVLAIVGLALLSARDAMARGLAEMHQAETSVRLVNVQRAPRLALHQTRGYIAQAHTDFAQATTRLDPLAPLVQHLAWLPGMGSDLAASPLAARTAEQLSGGILPLLDGLMPVADRFHGTSRHASIPVLLATLNRAVPDFQQSCAELHRAQSTRRALAGPQSARVTSALRSIDRQLPGLLRLCTGLQLAPTLLGVGRPKTYLVAFQNENELRATGGFIGSASLLTVSDGNVHQWFHSPVSATENFRVPSPDPQYLYNEELSWLFRDSNWSPDFPTSAALERYFFKLDFHASAQAVIDITAQAAADMLQAIGPVYSPEYHQWINAGNVAGLADYYAHWSAKPGPLQLGDVNTSRKQFTLIVARLILSRLYHLPVSALVHLGENMGSAIAHRDLLINFTDPREQALATMIGADGAINPTGADYLYVVDSNLSYNKLNPWIHVYVDYDATIRTDRWVQVHLTLRMVHARTPDAYLTQGIGPGAGSFGSPLDYADFVRVYVPNGAALVDQSGWTQPWTPGPAYGKTMFSGYIIIPNGQTRTIRLQYIVPPNIFLPLHGARYKLVVQHQPGSHPAQWHIAIHHDGTTSSWTIPNPSLDWKGVLPIQHRTFHPIPLPASSRPNVQPGAQIEPHARLLAPQSGNG